MGNAVATTKPEQTTAVAINSSVRTAVRNMQSTMEEFEKETAKGDTLGDLEFALMQSAYYDHLKTLMNGPVVQALRKLEGNKTLGYATDGRNYSDEQIRDALIQGIMLGGRVTNGELTIIAGQAYLGKEVIRRKIERWPGVSHLDCHTGAPESISNKTAAIPARATWLQNGERCECKMLKTEEGDFRAMVKMDVTKDGRVTSGVDQLKGKAESKLLRQVYKQITGRILPDAEPDTVDGEVVSSSVQAAAIGDDEQLNNFVIEMKDDLLSRAEHGTLGVNNGASEWRERAATELPKACLDEALQEIDSVAKDVCEAIRTKRGERSNG